MPKDIGRGIKEFKKSLSGEDNEDENVKAAEELTCTKCGSKFKAGTKFCPECGKKVVQSLTDK